VPYTDLINDAPPCLVSIRLWPVDNGSWAETSASVLVT